jgi:purine-nucleoside phosphorylase
MLPLNERLSETLAYLQSRTKVAPRVGLVLGSGLGEFADSLPRQTTIPTKEIPHYPLSTVEGHKGRLVFGEYRDVPVVAFQGRVHFYECASTDAVLYPIHVAHRLGVSILVLTNAAGGVNRAFRPGDLMVITDQINFTAERLEMPPDAPVTRRPLAYDRALIRKLDEVAIAAGIRLQHGVYAGMKGPSYETAAEIELAHRAGADAVGMSTVLEALLAFSLGMRLAGISCITNLATGISKAKLDHQEVTHVANKVRGDVSRLLSSFIAAG